MEQETQGGDLAEIRQGIEASLQDEAVIDERTARLIASQLHDGQASPYYALASSGYIDREPLLDSIARDAQNENLDEEARSWLGHLVMYVESTKPERPAVDSPRIWVGSLAAYNDGVLHGKWIAADREADEVWEDVNEVLRTSPVPAEEYFIADYENFAGLRLWEYEPIERVAQIGRLLVAYGDAFAAWLQYEGSDALGRAEEFTDAYVGEFSDREELQDHFEMLYGIEEMMDELHRKVSSSLSVYVEFDTEAFINDLECNGDIYIVERNGVMQVFQRI